MAPKCLIFHQRIARLCFQPLPIYGLCHTKRVFHAVGMDERGKIVLRTRLSRHALMPFL